MFSHNRANEHSQRRRVCFVELVRQVAAPGAKSAVSDCILFGIDISVIGVVLCTQYEYVNHLGTSSSVQKTIRRMASTEGSAKYLS